MFIVNIEWQLASLDGRELHIINGTAAKMQASCSG
jgi:hypothetical protein